MRFLCSRNFVVPENCRTMRLRSWLLWSTLLCSSISPSGSWTDRRTLRPESTVRWSPTTFRLISVRIWTVWRRWGRSEIGEWCSEPTAVCVTTGTWRCVDSTPRPRAASASLWVSLPRSKMCHCSLKGGFKAVCFEIDWNSFRTNWCARN